jgi:hypothetical protein
MDWATDVSFWLSNTCSNSEVIQECLDVYFTKTTASDLEGQAKHQSNISSPLLSNVKKEVNDSNNLEETFQQSTIEAFKMDPSVQEEQKRLEIISHLLFKHNLDISEVLLSDIKLIVRELKGDSVPIVLEKLQCSVTKSEKKLPVSVSEQQQSSVKVELRTTEKSNNCSFDNSYEVHDIEMAQINAEWMEYKGGPEPGEVALKEVDEEDEKIQEEWANYTHGKEPGEIELTSIYVNSFITSQCNNETVNTPTKCAIKTTLDVQSAVPLIFEHFRSRHCQEITNFIRRVETNAMPLSNVFRIEKPKNKELFLFKMVLGENIVPENLLQDGLKWSKLSALKGIQEAPKVRTRMGLKRQITAYPIHKLKAGIPNIGTLDTYGAMTFNSGKWVRISSFKKLVYVFPEEKLIAIHYVGNEKNVQ